MSLARFALRFAAVEAVKGRTRVGNNVLDSEIGAIDITADNEMRTDKDRPFTAVYTEKSKLNLSGSDVRGLLENGTCELCFETGVTAAMGYTDPATGKKELVEGIPVTDRTQEQFLDVTNYQIKQALTDPDNDWAEIFRKFCFSIDGYEIVRAGAQHEGARIAAQQLKITVHLIDDPEPGTSIEQNDAFSALVAKMTVENAPPLHVAYAAVIESLIIGNDEPWKVAQRRHGMNADELFALGLGPIAQDLDRTTPLFNKNKTNTKKITPHSDD